MNLSSKQNTMKNTVLQMHNPGQYYSYKYWNFQINSW